jgi:hypothetical protein
VLRAVAKNRKAEKNKFINLVLCFQDFFKFGRATLTLLPLKKKKKKKEVVKTFATSMMSLQWTPNDVVNHWNKENLPEFARACRCEWFER